MVRIVAILLLVACVGAGRAAEGDLTLVVTIANVVPKGGPMKIAVWRDGTGWPGTPPAGAATASVEADQDTVAVRMPGQQPGRLAVSVYQDTDRDGKLKMGTFGPQEPWGTSRNITHTFRGPSFDESVVEVTATAATVAITLHR